MGPLSVISTRPTGTYDGDHHVVLEERLHAEWRHYQVLSFDVRRSTRKDSQNAVHP